MSVNVYWAITSYCPGNNYHIHPWAQFLTLIMICPLTGVEVTKYNILLSEVKNNNVEAKLVLKTAIFIYSSHVWTSLLTSYVAIFSNLPNIHTYVYAHIYVCTLKTNVYIRIYVYQAWSRFKRERWIWRSGFLRPNTIHSKKIF